ncbi:hypothetical protein H4R34_003997, partial [Dimargaris verticillata]
MSSDSKRIADESPCPHQKRPKVDGKPASTRTAQQYPHGNFPNYYGYRHLSVAPSALANEPRLAVLRPEWVHGQRVLDIGCNTGLITAYLAQHGSPQWIVGVDIDRTLVQKAKGHVNFVHSLQYPALSAHTRSTPPSVTDTHYFPLSMPLLYGQVAAYHPLLVPVAYRASGQTLAQLPPLRFPQNIFLYATNWAAEDLAALPTEYDLILALSVAKWIHLNQGDTGIQAFFAKVYQQLAFGGRFLFEPQPWESYANSCKVNAHLHHTFKTIKFFPSSFTEYLLQVVGFQSVEQLQTPDTYAK